ncbi:hypothetical protein [Enterococcus dongliensis]|uniref:hypothetical protein n=1 Tax=Enterococcus dongliensis TaxID=2559925 RepID=UPI0028911023|nr:hypothetical protein [Enterococcus dongliensis]MDT2670368.1 hypothetical protein [Enterococcus dongliensis]
MKDETELTGNQVESTTEGIGVEQSSISESPIETTGEIEAISEESSAITASDSQVETPVKTPVESTDFSIVDKENETVINYTNDQKSHNVLVSANIKAGDRLEVVTPWIFNAMSDDVMGMEKNKVVVDVSEQTGVSIKS